MQKLDQKISSIFSGLVVRKDLVKTVKGNAIVPTYVLEYLLGQYCATSDEATIQSGIQTVREILSKHYVHRSESGLVRSHIREKGRHKVIDKISVALNDKTDTYEADFSNLGIDKVLVDSDTIRKHPKLLISGVWCIADLEYSYTEDKRISPWILTSLKPIQLSDFDYQAYLEAREQFSTEEWIDLLLQSIGLNPALFGRRSKLTQLIRLIPFCERNYNLLELGPKGTGKSHVYSEFSPHGILLSGGEVTVPKLFVNNSTGRIGLVGYWDCIAFDEFAGKDKKIDKALVDILKNYMAQKTFSRGIETLGAEASMAFVGNTRHTVAYMLKHSDLFEEIPPKFYDPAFLDRIHFYIPGWEVDIIRGEMFSSGFGFVVDYLAEVLRFFRNQDCSHHYQNYFTLSSDISTRDRDGIHKTFSGLMKILYPHAKATNQEIEEIFRFAIEGRKRVKDQLLRIDATYDKVNFSYTTSEGTEHFVKTLEETEFPACYYKNPLHTEQIDQLPQALETPVTTHFPEAATKLREGHFTYTENQKGISYNTLFGPYLVGATVITLTDPYIRLFYQIRNFMEFLETVIRHKNWEDEISVHLVTVEDEFKSQQQIEHFQAIAQNALSIGLKFTWDFVPPSSTHARHIVTNHGWKISLDRGLDLFQHYEMNDTFHFANRLQEFRPCKPFEVTYIFGGGSPQNPSHPA